MNATETTTYNLLILCGMVDEAEEMKRACEASRQTVRRAKRASDAKHRRAVERLAKLDSEMNNIGL